MLLSVFILISVLSTQSFSSNVSLELHLYPDAEENKLQCNDGSPGGYYLRPAPEDAEDGARDRWIFYLEGGGWCWNVTQCFIRIVYNHGDSWLVSSTNWPPTQTFSAGLFQMTDTPWENANLVYVPYCSSDAHMGDTDVEIPFLGVQQFRGRRLAREAVSRLVGMKENQEIIFGGCSAGGRGSMVLVDFVSELVHESTNIYGLHDSGAYQDIDPHISGYYPFGMQCHDAYHMFSPPISSKCSDLYGPDSLYKCVCGEYMLPLVVTPSQVIIYQYDSYQLDMNIGHKPKYWTEDMCRYAEHPFRSGMLTTVADIWENENHVVFAPACYHHCLLMEDSFNSIKVDDVSAQDQLMAWIEDSKRLRAVSTCNGVNCQSTCPELEVGDHTFCDYELLT